MNQGIAKRTGIKVADIAKTAGVSPSTVDRVLKGRSGVHPKTLAKIRSVINSINNLPGTKIRNVGFILPGLPNIYMNEIYDYIVENYGDFLHRGFRTIPRQTDTFDYVKIVETLNDLSNECDAIVLYAIDHPLIRDAVENLNKQNIKVVTLITDLTYSGRSCFFGINNLMAGRIAGHFMGKFLDGKKGNLALIAGSFKLQDHIQREAGFKQVIQEKFPDLDLKHVIEANDDYIVIKDRLMGILSDPELLGIYNVGAGNNGVVDAIECLGREGKIRLIGHELTEHTKRFLIEEKMDLVIHQNYKPMLDNILEYLTDCESDLSPQSVALEKVELFCKENVI